MPAHRSFVLLAIVCLLSTRVYATSGVNWAVVIKGFEHKIPRLEMRGEKDAVSYCSSVVYRVDADKRALALTAAHCVANPKTEHFDITANRHHAEVVLYNNLPDLAVITFKARNETAIAIANEAPETGTEVAVLGYAFGIDEMAIQSGIVSQKHNRETKSLWINVDLIFGDSGGAVIDGQGQLVGINSKIYSRQGIAHLGGAVSIEEVQEFIEAADRKLAKEKP